MNMKRIAVKDIVTVQASSGSAIYTGKTGTVIKLREVGNEFICTVSMSEDNRELKFMESDLNIIGRDGAKECPPAGTSDHW